MTILIHVPCGFQCKATLQDYFHFRRFSPKLSQITINIFSSVSTIRRRRQFVFPVRETQPIPYASGWQKPPIPTSITIESS